MFCSNCGAQIPDNVKFCTNCGTQVIQPGNVPPQAPAANNITPSWEPVINNEAATQGSSMKSTDNGITFEKLMPWLITAIPAVMFVIDLILGNMIPGAVFNGVYIALIFADYYGLKKRGIEIKMVWAILGVLLTPPFYLFPRAKKRKDNYAYAIVNLVFICVMIALMIMGYAVSGDDTGKQLTGSETREIQQSDVKYKTVSLDEFSYEVPSAWAERIEKDTNKNGSGYHYYYPKGEEVPGEMLCAYTTSFDIKLDDDLRKRMLDTSVEVFLSEDGVTDTKDKRTEYNGHPAAVVSRTITDQDGTLVTKACYAFSDERLICITCSQYEGSSSGYEDAFAHILDSIYTEGNEL